MFPPAKKKPAPGGSELDVVGGLMAADAPPEEAPPEEAEAEPTGDPEVLVSEIQSKLAELKTAMRAI